MSESPEFLNVHCSACDVDKPATQLFVCRACYDDQMRRKREGKEKANERLAALRAAVDQLRAQLYATQCQDCAGQGMPTKAARYCGHCGEPFARVVEVEE